eukprot:179891_1
MAIVLLLPLCTFAASLSMSCDDNEISGRRALAEEVEIVIDIALAQTVHICGDRSGIIYSINGSYCPCNDDYYDTKCRWYLSAGIHTFPVGFVSVMGGYGGYTISVSCPSSSSLTFPPTPAPTDYAIGDFPGADLIIKGVDIFRGVLSGSPILNSTMMEQNAGNSYSTEAQTCSYNSLEFNSEFEKFSAYSSTNAQLVEAGFNSGDTYSAAGSLSVERTQTKTYAQSGQNYIYTMSLECKAAAANIVGYNDVYWDIYFIQSVKILPNSYSTGDDLREYIDFWKTYGTHTIKSALFGGSINGAVVVNKCLVDTKFKSTSQYEACLNGAYKGVVAEGCVAEGTSRSSGLSIKSTIENTQITVHGGSPIGYQDIFDQFGNKEADFQNWIIELAMFPDIVGGNAIEIHTALEDSLQLGKTMGTDFGDHKLNNGLGAKSLSDTEWQNIIDALQKAYVDYSQQLAQENNLFTDGECDIDCYGGESDTAECVCTQCSSATDCCGVDGATKPNIFSSVCIVILSFFVAQLL